MSAFQSDLARFEQRSAQVLGVSSDRLETHREFAASLDLDFPLVADDGTLCRLYGSGRITYLIDRIGIIRFVQKGMPDIAVLLGALDALTES